MGVRKRNTAERRKEASKSQYQAILRNCPTSPRKMRLVTDLIRGEEVNRALDILKYSSQEASRRLEKLLLSAIANWQSKNEGVRIEESKLYIKTIYVDGGRTMKRLQTAPQGRAYRLRKRSNHVTLVLDSRNKEIENTSK
ncbi:MAG TPA: 50S ribosomal protein L22 [Bacteroidales bacterium]|jgi:large subunit ribosomal protein L22|nr:50S ribosomal protein L22 [Bacteroidales bacterium]HQB36339.1 50S ribosomal protein L22 [Bacteroidales bacterium]